MSTAYEVRVHGVASARLVESLCADVDMSADTILHGIIEDQAALHGLLARIRDIGLEIADVRQVSYWQGPPPGSLGPTPPQG
jgi:hypothetical protein